MPSKAYFLRVLCSSVLSTLQREILSRLSGGPADVRSLAAQIRRDIRHILECVPVLLREKKIIEESDGKLRINP